MDLPDALDGQYNPTESEDDVYQLWSESDFFNPEACIDAGLVDADADTFSIVLPPPNVTGTLHVGHAAMMAIEDIMVRYHRMQGKRTLWIPGTDHAAIATQSKVERILTQEEGKTRFDLGREDFLKRVERFAQDSHDTIVKQTKKMGASIDWSREAYTLDTQRHHAVRTAFTNMYEEGLIYRGERVVNWDPNGQTTVSDDEVEHEETHGTLYTFRYSNDFPIPIATTRPETKLGDTAVAVHPDDDRYSEYVGETFTIDNFAGETLRIEVVADESIDSEFGTGAVGLTPAHSKTDWRIAERHDLEVKQIINEYAQIENCHDKVDGMSTDEARDYVVSWLKDNELLKDTETVKINKSTAERSGGIIEPLPKRQWFIDVEKTFELKDPNIEGFESGDSVTLKEWMRHVVENENIDILPDRFEKVYFHWIDKLRDWCISRQIWFGHRVPYFVCFDCNKKQIQENFESLASLDEALDESTEVTHQKARELLNNGKKAIVKGIDGFVSKDAEPACEECSADNLLQDPDTLDTWFSSGLWTFSTLGWPDDAEAKDGKPMHPADGTDLDIYHPTNVLETGYDILFFWVARMILMTGYHLEDIPFETVYLHGMVRDENGDKMSKSDGNVIDPLDIIEEYGADALRMSLVVGTGPGNDMNLSEDKAESYKHFANKIWNATKFVLMNLPEDYTHEKPSEIPHADKERIQQLNQTIDEVTENIEAYRFHLAAENIHQYFWHTFADEVIEESKDRIYGEDPTAKRQAQWLLYTILTQSLRMLHPFIPYVTERLWQSIPDTDNLLIVSKWPEQINI